jgi:hypothetical protein
MLGENGDETPIYYSSLALMTFQRAFGLFSRIMGKGDAAKVSLPRPWCARCTDIARRNWPDYCNGIIRLDCRSSATSSRPSRSTG